MRARVVAVLAILIGYGVLQSVWLPPDGFFAGDCAAKYLQARAVLANGPFRPWIEGPAIDAEGPEAALARSIDWLSERLVEYGA